MNTRALLITEEFLRNGLCKHAARALVQLRAVLVVWSSTLMTGRRQRKIWLVEFS